MRAPTVILLCLFTGCSEPTFEPQVALQFLETTGDATVADGADVPRDARGNVRVRVSACVPDLPSARATVTSPRELGDGGPASRTVILLAPAIAPTGCPSGGLAGETRIPVPATDSRVELELELLGTRSSWAATVEPFSGLSVSDITFLPPEIPPGGGIVTVTFVTPSVPDGTALSLRALPPVPMSTLAPEVLRGTARAVVSIPADVAGVWIEARIGLSAPRSGTVRRGSL